MLDSIRQFLQAPLRFWLGHIPLRELYKLSNQVVLAPNLAVQVADVPHAGELLVGNDEVGWVLEERLQNFGFVEDAVVFVRRVFASCRLW